MASILEIKSGVLANRLGDITPAGFIAFDPQSKELSINSFDADRIMGVEVLLTADQSPSKVIPYHAEESVRSGCRRRK